MDTLYVFSCLTNVNNNPYYRFLESYLLKIGCLAEDFLISEFQVKPLVCFHLYKLSK